MAGRSAETSALWVRQMGLTDRVVAVGPVTDAELAELYNLADCFVFPSLTEGFGLPVLEAQACGCPVVCSNAGSLPEVAGPLCAAVNPPDTRAIADAIRLVLESPGFRADAEAANAEWLTRFSWEPARHFLREWFAQRDPENFN